MGSYSLEVVIRKWRLDELGVEQAIGQILLILQELAKRTEELEGRSYGLQKVNQATVEE